MGLEKKKHNTVRVLEMVRILNWMLLDCIS